MKRADFIEKWLEALESGEYKQIKNKLREHTSPKSYGYCCLGVACDVANKVGARRVSEDVLKKDLMLPVNMQLLIGINDSGDFKESISYQGKKYSNLTGLNDDGVRFKTIARIIREQLAANNFEKP